jgi:hypothetical protein
MAFALYHPAAALRTPDIERTSYADVARIPAALLESRSRREPVEAAEAVPVAVPAGSPPAAVSSSAAVAIAAAPPETLAEKLPDSEPDFTLF